MKENKAERVSCPTTEPCYCAEMSLSCPICSRASQSWSNLVEEESDFPNAFTGDHLLNSEVYRGSLWTSVFDPPQEPDSWEYKSLKKEGQESS